MMMNTELKKVVTRVKSAQTQLQTLLKDQAWIEDARKYAERQGKEVKKLFAADFGKVRAFLGRERKELERFQKQIPGEVKKLRKFVAEQRKEFGKLLLSMRKTAPKKAAASPKKKTAGNNKKSTTPTETTAKSE